MALQRHPGRKQGTGLCAHPGRSLVPRRGHEDWNLAASLAEGDVRVRGSCGGEGGEGQE